MKVLRILVPVAFGLFTCMGICDAQSKTLNVDEIIQKSNHMSLYQGNDCKGKIAMAIADKQGRTRKREFNMLRRDDGESDMDQKYFIFFHEPADIRKMVFMVHKHAGRDKDDDRWLYMPSLDLVKRIAASDKRTSFVGSNFLYEDISGRNPTEDAHELVETTDTYYVIKNTPKNPENVEFEYYIAHIDKRTFIPMKIEYFKKGNRMYRVLETEKVSEIEADEKGERVTYPTATVSIAKDLENESTSKMVFSNIQYNTGITDRYFSERYLRRPPRDAMR